MPISTTGYVPNKKVWKKTANAEIERSGRQTHSEITVHSELMTAGSPGPFLILQDAFPCSECSAEFITKTTTSKKRKFAPSIAFKITANNGKYSADHDLGQDYGTFPTYIWYHNGAKTISTTLAGRPAAFPICPSENI